MLKEENEEMQNEMTTWAEEREQLMIEAEGMKREFEDTMEKSMQENTDIRQQIDQLQVENMRFNEEKSEKDHLIKELTSKNLELLARLATVEATLKPLNDDLKS